MSVDGDPVAAVTRLEPWRLQCLLNLRLEGNDEYASTMGWLIDRLRQMWTDLTGTDPVDDRQVVLSWSAQPEHGRAWGSDPLTPARSTRSFARLHESLLRGGGDLALGWFWEGLPDGVWRPRMKLLASGRYDLATSFAVVELAYPDATEPNLAAVEAALVALLSDAVTTPLPLTFGNVSDDNDVHNRTAFDDATIRRAAALTRPDEFARSYSWVTYLPEILASRLSPPGSLTRDHGLFRAEPLGTGLLVQATEHLADHAGASVLALRRALDPVLEQRATARSTPGFNGGLRVVWDDGTIGPLDHGNQQVPSAEVPGRKF